MPARDTSKALPAVSTWLIDAYNVLHAGLLHREQRTRFWKREHRERLVDRVRDFTLPKTTLFVAFDGDDPGRHEVAPLLESAWDRLFVVYAANADAWILEEVRHALHPEDVAVVTGDRSLAGKARHRGASIVSPRTFLDHCPRHPSPAREATDP